MKPRPGHAAVTGDGTLLPLLAPDERAFVERLLRDYRLTQQELRIVAQAVRDLAMWREEPLESWWGREETHLSKDGARAVQEPRQRKRALLQRLHVHLAELAAAPRAYPATGLAAPTRRRVELVQSATPRKVFGKCPAHSDRTVCCGLHTIDAVLGCAFDCSYCTIQTFYGSRAEVPADLSEQLDAVSLDPARFYHVGTGQSSDSLLWGDRAGLLDALFRFARRHPNVLLELKSKSDNVGPLLARDVPANVVCSWTLNSEAIVRNEEHGTANLPRRLSAAWRLAARGISVAFHLHPLVWHDGWQGGYGELVEQLLRRFRAQQVAFVSLGTMTFIKPVAAEIRRRGGETRVLQMPLAKDPHGKLTYPDPIKVELYRTVYERLHPWHERVFIYLCMEKAEIWRASLGRCYASNAAFETDFALNWQKHRSGTRPDPETASAAAGLREPDHAPHA